MTRNKKLWLGVATVWPIVYMFLFMGFVISQFIAGFSGGFDSVSFAFFPIFLIIFPLHILTMILIVALMVILIKHAIENKKLNENERILWIIVLFVANVFAMPIYWYVNVWKGEGEIKTVK